VDAVVLLAEDDNFDMLASADKSIVIMAGDRFHLGKEGFRFWVLCPAEDERCWRLSNGEVIERSARLPCQLYSVRKRRKV
jgi:hypothetical protein